MDDLDRADVYAQMEREAAISRHKRPASPPPCEHCEEHLAAVLSNGAFCRYCERCRAEVSE